MSWSWFLNWRQGELGTSERFERAKGRFHREKWSNWIDFPKRELDGVESLLFVSRNCNPSQVKRNVPYLERETEIEPTILILSHLSPKKKNSWHNNGSQRFLSFQFFFHNAWYFTILISSFYLPLIHFLPVQIMNQHLMIKEKKYGIEDGYEMRELKMKIAFFAFLEQIQWNIQLDVWSRGRMLCYKREKKRYWIPDMSSTFFSFSWSALVAAEWWENVCHERSKTSKDFLSPNQ